MRRQFHLTMMKLLKDILKKCAQKISQLNTHQKTSPYGISENLTQQAEQSHQETHQNLLREEKLMINEMLFKTPYGERKRVFVSSGNRYQNEYSYTKNKKGSTILEKTGETDLYEKIQESLEDTKIENIIRRVTAGDDSMLRPNGIYADCTELPSNLIESQKAIMDLENVWAKLPIRTKEEYNFDKGQFVAEAGSEKWLKSMGYKAETNEMPIETIKQETTTETKGEAEA